MAMKRLFHAMFALGLSVYLFLPQCLWAEEGATNLVVVADTRRVSSGILRYVADLYNTNPWAFASIAVLLTACYGAFLGFSMDRIMEHSGLDLKSRKILEH
jgi:hypothetical protein